MPKIETGIECPWTKEQMAAWKKAGEVYEGTITADEITYQFAFKKPDLPVMKRVQMLLFKEDYISAGEVLLDNCWLAGHDAVKSNPSNYLSASVNAALAINRSIPSCEVKLVKS